MQESIVSREMAERLIREFQAQQERSSNPRGCMVEIAGEGKYAGITLSASLAWRGVGNTTYASGGIRLDVRIAVVKLGLKNQAQRRRLGPGWTLEQAQRAASRLAAWAMYNADLDRLAQELAAKVKPLLESENWPAFNQYILDVERKTGRTIVYSDMTPCDITFWTKAVDHFAKGGTYEMLE